MMIALLFIASNAACVFIGWLLGKTGRNAAVVAAAVEEQAETKEGARATLPFRALAIAVVVVSAVTALNSVLVTANQSQFGDCVSGQFDKLVVALVATRKANRESQSELKEVFGTIVTAYRNPTPAAAKSVRDAIESYFRSAVRAEQAQRQNPIPDPPRNACRQ